MTTCYCRDDDDDDDGGDDDKALRNPEPQSLMPSLVSLQHNP